MEDIASDAAVFRGFVSRVLASKANAGEDLTKINKFVDELLVSYNTVQNLKELLHIENDFDLVADVRQLVQTQPLPVALNRHFKSQLALALDCADQNVSEEAILRAVWLLKRCKIGILVPISADEHASLSSVLSEIVDRVNQQDKSLRSNFQEICIDTVLFGLQKEATYEEIVARIQEIAQGVEELRAARDGVEQYQGELRAIRQELGVGPDEDLVQAVRTLRDQLQADQERHVQDAEIWRQHAAKSAQELADAHRAAASGLEKAAKVQMELDALSGRFTVQMVELQKRNDEVRLLEAQLIECKRLIQDGMM